MSTRTTVAALAGTALLALTGCGAATVSDKPAAPRTTPATPTPATPSKATTPSKTTETASLPSMTGKGLQYAQDQAQAAGFYGLTSHDALGRGRMQAFDRNWKVCSQTPAAGKHATDTKIDFATVKLEEECPSKDAGTPQAAGSTMPDFQGKSVKAAREALDSGYSITVHDATGQNRIVFMESNWQICTQNPTPGTKLDGRPVKFNAVKFNEPC
jgi:beta-lactam-binding protein with PASTA domain